MQSNLNISTKETFRLVQQFLVSQGLSHVAKQIEKETNVSMEDQSVELFRFYILNGEFRNLFQASNDEKTCVFDKITVSLDRDKKRILEYYIYEQEYIELLHAGKSIEAIALLQKELVPRSPFGKDKSNLFKLASMVMNVSQNENDTPDLEK